MLSAPGAELRVEFEGQMIHGSAHVRLGEDYHQGKRLIWANNNAIICERNVDPIFVSVVAKIDLPFEIWLTEKGSKLFRYVSVQAKAGIGLSLEIKRS